MINSQIPIYKGAAEALIPRPLEIDSFHGINGMGDVEFWRHDLYPSNENEIIQPESAVQIIRDLILKVTIDSGFTTETVHGYSAVFRVLPMFRYVFFDHFILILSMEPIKKKISFSVSEQNIADMPWTINKYCVSRKNIFRNQR